MNGCIERKRALNLIKWIFNIIDLKNSSFCFIKKYLIKFSYTCTMRIFSVNANTVRKAWEVAHSAFHYVVQKPQSLPWVVAQRTKPSGERLQNPRSPTFMICFFLGGGGLRTGFFHGILFLGIFVIIQTDINATFINSAIFHGIVLKYKLFQPCPNTNVIVCLLIVFNPLFCFNCASPLHLWKCNLKKNEKINFAN